MTCSDCSKDKTIDLVNGNTVCNYCPDYAAECLSRENDAKRLIGMPRDLAKVEYRRRKDEGEDLTKLDAVIKRLKAANFN